MIQLQVQRGAGLSVSFQATSLGDTTGWQAHSQFRQGGVGGQLIWDLTVGTGITIVGSTSTFTITLTGAQTAAAAPTPNVLDFFNFDLFVEAPSGQPLWLATGSSANSSIRCRLPTSSTAMSRSVWWASHPQLQYGTLKTLLGTLSCWPLSTSGRYLPWPKPDRCESQWYTGRSS